MKTVCGHKRIHLQQVTLAPSHVNLKCGKLLALACVDCGETLLIDRTREIIRILNRRFDSQERRLADLHSEIKHLNLLIGRQTELLEEVFRKFTRVVSDIPRQKRIRQKEAETAPTNSSYGRNLL